MKVTKVTEPVVFSMHAHHDAKPVLPVTKSDKAFAEMLMKLEPLLDGRVMKLAYTGYDKKPVSVRGFALTDQTNRTITWKWNSTLAHEILKGTPTNIQPAFVTAIKTELANRKQVSQPKSKVEQAIALMKSMSAKDRQLVLDGLTPVGTKLAPVPDTSTRVGRRIAKETADKIAKKVIKEVAAKPGFPAPKDDRDMKTKTSRAKKSA